MGGPTGSIDEVLGALGGREGGVALGGRGGARVVVSVGLGPGGGSWPIMWTNYTRISHILRWARDKTVNSTKQYNLVITMAHGFTRVCHIHVKRWSGKLVHICTHSVRFIVYIYNKIVYSHTLGIG